MRTLATGCWQPVIKYENIISGLYLYDRGGRRVRYAYIVIFAFILLNGYSLGETPFQPESRSAVQTPAKEDLSPDQIIQSFAEKETEFYEAWMGYTYTQNAVIRVLSVDGRPHKETMTIVSEVVFNDDGTREVRTLHRSGRLRSVLYTEDDQEVIDNINPFALTTKELPLYNLKYQGKERVDELDCYVFYVEPKDIEKNRFYFKGKIWVDDLDLQVVRTVGKPVPQTRENQFPEFETIRQIIDDKYWFPVWTHADSQLRFPGQVVRIEETITYEDYKRFRSKATIQYNTGAPPKDSE
jgi:hypothetical protein